MDSKPSRELFEQHSQEYRARLSPGVPVEEDSTLDGACYTGLTANGIGMETFGDCAPFKALQ